MARKRKHSRAPGLKVRWRNAVGGQRIAYAVGTLPGYDKPIRRSLRATGQADADAACLALQNDLLGALKAQEENSKKGPKYVEAANSYLAAWEDKVKDRREARGGRYKFSYRWYGPILKRIGDMYISDITTGFITKLAAEMLPNGSTQYRGRHIVAAITATINHYADLGMCAPVRGNRKNGEAKKKKTYVTREWLDKFVAAGRELTKTTGDVVYIRIACAAMFMYMTGARRMEATEWLRVEHFDLDKRRAVLPGEFLKNGKERVYHLPRELVMFLREVMPEEGRVFGLPYADAIYKPWRKIVEKADIPYVPPHQEGRHSFGTNVGARVGKDLDIATATELGGWEDKGIFLNNYVHSTKDHLQSVDDIFEAPKKGLKSVKGGKE